MISPVWEYCIYNTKTMRMVTRMYILLSIIKTIGVLNCLNNGIFCIDAELLLSAYFKCQNIHTSFLIHISIILIYV